MYQGRRYGRRLERFAEMREDLSDGAAARADPVGGLVWGQHVADTGDAAARVTSYREPLQREGRTGAIPQEVFKARK